MQIVIGKCIDKEIPAYEAVMRESQYLETFDTMFDPSMAEEHKKADKVFTERSEKQHQHA